MPADLLTSPFYLAVIGAVVATAVLAWRRAGRVQAAGRRSFRDEAGVPLDAAVGGDWRYSEILEYTHDAIVIWEMEGDGIVYWNRAAENIYGWSRREAAGRTTHRLLQTQLDGGVNQLEAMLSRYGVWAGELKHTRKDGVQIVVQSRLSLMAQQNGRWLVLEVNRDLGTEDRRAADVHGAMTAHLARLRRAHNAD